MCKYCEEPTKNIRLHKQDTDSNISDCFIHKANDGAALFLRQSFIVKPIDNFRIAQDNEFVYIDIKYCPFCGKKL